MGYPGGKNGAGTYQKIINQLPPHRVYIEPFLGSGAIMRHKRPAAINIGGDLDRDVLEDTASRIQPGRVIIHDDPQKLIAAAARVESDDAGPHWFWFHGSAMLLLAFYDFQGDELLYLDPPYLMTARRGGQALYHCEMGNAEDHESLLSLIADTYLCNTALSGYESALYNERLALWRLYQFQAMTRGGSLATECLWMNYPTPPMLHDYRFLGEDYRERERIKRRKTRWVARLENMDEHERWAILWAIQESGLLGPLPS